MEYETEEQQVEAIKKWWKENSSTVVTSVAIGVAAIFGWQYYQVESIKHTEQASVLYEQVLINSSNLSGQVASVNELEAEFNDTPYASLSALIVAKQYLETGETEKAQQQYQWVIENAKQDELKYLAKIRLARVLLGDNKQSEALALLNETYPESFNAMVFELKGDVQTLKGDKKTAKASYLKAMSLSKGSNRWLQLKIDDLGEVSAQAEKPVESEPSA